MKILVSTLLCACVFAAFASAPTMAYETCEPRKARQESFESGPKWGLFPTARAKSGAESDCRKYLSGFFPEDRECGYLIEHNSGDGIESTVWWDLLQYGTPACYSRRNENLQYLRRSYWACSAPDCIENDDGVTCRVRTYCPDHP